MIIIIICNVLFTYKLLVIIQGLEKWCPSFRGLLSRPKELSFYSLDIYSNFLYLTLKDISP